MKKCNIFGAITITMLVSLGGCSTNDDYCCTSNDQCVPVHGNSTSCTTATCGKCLESDPIQINVVDWKDASVESSYNIELTASGGIPPYTWEFTSSDIDKLGWLTLTWEGTNNETGKLRNRDGQYPSNPTTGDGIPLTITVKDNTRHGKDIRLDNQGASKEMNLKIINTVADPVFYPAQGTYNIDQAISLSCDTSGATIYYTADGDTPTTTSTLYTGTALDVKGPNNTTTIKAIAVKEDMAQSFVSSSTYTVRYQYQLTITGSSGGTTSPSGQVTVDYGEATSISAAPSNGFKFTNWTTNDTGVTFGDATKMSTTVKLTEGNATIQSNFTELVTDVYAAGFAVLTSPLRMVAMYWKNGVVNSLTDDGGNGAMAESMFVYGSDVYIAGVVGNLATLWKNEEIYWENVSGGVIGSNSVFVSGIGDVYFVGSETNGTISVAKVWKNKELIWNTDGIYSAWADSVFIDNDGHYYVAGVEKGANGNGIVKVWKDGTLFETLTNGDYDAEASSVFVDSNGAVYVAGSQHSGNLYEDGKTRRWVAMLWTNNYAQSLSDVTQDAMVNGVSVAGDGTVYVAGEINSIATVWTNGYAKSYASTQLSSATAVFVHGDDFYVSGYVDGNGKVWKNGKDLMALSGGTPMSIFVITH